GWDAAAGPPARWPWRVRARSQIPAEARHSVVDGLNASAGHAAPLPVQLSATSQIPAEARHSVVDGLNASAGQSADVPVQLSATSHGPAEARHSVVTGLNDPSAFVQGPSFLSLNVQVTVSPLCKTMLPGVCVCPWSLVQVELVNAQPLGTLSATEYVPSGRDPPLNRGSASLRLKGGVAPPGLAT